MAFSVLSIASYSGNPLLGLGGGNRRFLIFNLQSDPHTADKGHDIDNKHEEIIEDNQAPKDDNQEQDEDEGFNEDNQTPKDDNQEQDEDEGINEDNQTPEDDNQESPTSRPKRSIPFQESTNHDVQQRNEKEQQDEEQELVNLQCIPKHLFVDLFFNDLFIMDSYDLHFLDIFLINSLCKKGWLLVQVNNKSLDILDIVEGYHLLIVDALSYLDVLDIVEGCHLFFVAEIFHFQLQECNNNNRLFPIDNVGFSHLIGGFAMYKSTECKMHFKLCPTNFRSCAANSTGFSHLIGGFAMYKSTKCKMHFKLCPTNFRSCAANSTSFKLNFNSRKIDVVFDDNMGTVFTFTVTIPMQNFGVSNIFMGIKFLSHEIYKQRVILKEGCFYSLL